MKNRLFSFLRKKPRKEEESLRQELGKQEGEARKGGARGSPSLGRLCLGSGNLSSGRLVLACALLQFQAFLSLMKKERKKERKKEDARLNLKELTRLA
ncbi:unnamed protein product [Sphenostylis stenocarpa]|uniref:Uncharacterized protein n=1 Tax=Sphenostylis stenocarpa TaxID=92480 RepID=A0AA86SN50_9FABA|nr:unnamed protein product [Sphenostylis stenocarpa]